MTLKAQAGETIVAVVEAKFRSGPSGWPTGPETHEVTGQLGQEWLALAELPAWEAPGSPARIERRLLLYITADLALPERVDCGDES